MDTQQSPVCVLNTVSAVPDIQSKQVLDQQSVPSELLYFISVEQDNGAPQLVQVTEEQANALGIYLNDNAVNKETNSCETDESAKNDTNTDNNNLNTRVNDKLNLEIENSTIKPLGSCENPIQIIRDGERILSTQDISTEYLQQIANALNVESNKTEELQEVDASNIDNDENVIYRVMYPDELQLIPSQSKRGRPRKRLKSDIESKVKTAADETKLDSTKPVQNMRTRSGRITRPPRHIRKDFRKIETNKYENDFKVVDFEPLKTNQPCTTEQPLVELEEPLQQKRKRSIASQYRCHVCQKAYLGRHRMLIHFQTHPDHGPVPNHLKLEENDTWNYLIDIANSNPVGQRGLKFCKQLITLLKNVQILTKILFKRPSGTEKNLCFIDSLLSKVLGISSGHYIMNENSLRKDVNLLRFIMEDMPKCNSTSNTEETNTVNERKTIDNRSLDEIDSARINITENRNSTLTFSGIRNDPLNVEITSDKLQNLNFQDLEFDQTIAASFPKKRRSKNRIELPVNVCSSSNNKQNNLDNITNGYSLHSDILSSANPLLNSLPTLRTSVDELILDNVDSAQVTNLLDNSVSSDEVMNVDQFVNERFKNFSEPDIDLPNPPLSLDLPTLDLFHFHSS